MDKNVLVAIYSHAELYPPTLNAVHELSKIYSKVILIQRANLEDKWEYPENVLVISQGKLLSPREQEQLPLMRKVWLFAGFTLTLLSNIKKYRPHCVLLFDPLALFLYHSIRRVLPKGIVTWYHNHDVPVINQVRKYSISWFAVRSQAKAFKYLSIFTLPSADRLSKFPLLDFKGKCFVIPNYPRKSFYSQFYKIKKIEGSVKLIYQGHASRGHGLEEIIELLPLKVLGNHLQLLVKGPCLEVYRKSLELKASQSNVLDKISFYGVTPYSEVPKLSSLCHIGIGIHAKNDIMNVTLGTASNKLYEYAAVGLPILYYNKEYFTKYLSKYKWAIATELTPEAILASIEKIVSTYEAMSEAAYSDFISELNYEFFFKPLHEHLSILIDGVRSQ